ncbi:MAG: sel1 repeat family protein [Rhodobacteraceae bacterium]|nr:sel1 repeat family protein [Paracoccaceae bacterium]
MTVAAFDLGKSGKGGAAEKMRNRDLPLLVPGQFVSAGKDWQDETCQLYMIWGILNPNGPTLYTLGSVKPDSSSRIFFRWMHFLGGETVFSPTQLKPVMYQDIFDETLRIQEHLRSGGKQGLFDVIPDFFVIDGRDETLSRMAQDLLQHLSPADLNWGRYIAYVRQFGTDYFGRAGAEIREFYEDQLLAARRKGLDEPKELGAVRARYGGIPQFTEAELPSWTYSKQTADILQEWWSFVSAEEHQVSALATLRAMWNGASGFSKHAGLETVSPWAEASAFLNGLDFAFSANRLTPRELEALHNEAQKGNIDAQCELASRLLFGDGVEKNPTEAAQWLEMASSAGNSWAQTAYAVELRRSGGAAEQTRALELLRQATNSGNARANMLLGMSFIEGAVVDTDRPLGLAHLINAALAGDEAARKALHVQAATDFPSEDWTAAFDRVPWPKYTFLLGPAVAGHFADFPKKAKDVETDLGKQWMVDEASSVRDWFSRGGVVERSFSALFDQTIAFADPYIGLGIIDGQPVTVVTVSAKDLVDERGFPMIKALEASDLDVAASIIGSIDGRKWVRTAVQRIPSSDVLIPAMKP